MNRPAATRPWVLFVAIFVLCAPLIIFGALSSARVLPGIPLSGFAFLSIAAVAFWAAWHTHGLAGMRALLGRVFDAQRARPRTWLLVSALVFPAVLVAEYLMMRAAHVPLPVSQVEWLQAPALFVAFFIGAVGEEVAWSATLLEPLQARHGAFNAALVIGVFGVALHVVPFAQANPSVSWVIGQCLFVVGFRVIVAWIYNVSGYSLFAAVVCHAAYNTSWQLFPNHGSGYSPWITAVLTWTVVGVVVTVCH